MIDYIKTYKSIITAGTWNQECVIYDAPPKTMLADHRHLIPRNGKPRKRFSIVGSDVDLVVGEDLSLIGQVIFIRDGHKAAPVFLPQIRELTQMRTLNKAFKAMFRGLYDAVVSQACTESAFWNDFYHEKLYDHRDDTIRYRLCGSYHCEMWLLQPRRKGKVASYSYLLVDLESWRVYVYSAPRK